MNFAAVSLALGLPAGPLVAAAMAADIFAMAAYLVVCSLVPAPGAEARAACSWQQTQTSCDGSDSPEHSLSGERSTSQLLPSKGKSRSDAVLA